MKSHFERAPRPRIPLVLLPFVVYVGVTVIAPAANGALQREGFWEHAGITASVCAVIAGVAWAVQRKREVSFHDPASGSALPGARRAAR